MELLRVTTHLLPMHKEPHSLSEVVSEALYGESLAFVDSSGEWTLVKNCDGYQGWIKLEVLEKKGSKNPNATVESLWAHVYRVQDTTPYPPEMTLSFGSFITVEDVGDKRWLRFFKGEEAFWIQRGDVRLERSSRSFEEMLQLAKRFIGIPYKWGGRSGFGYDCSGFMQMLFSEMGVAIPRDISDQMKYGKEISRGSLSIGDIVFFRGLSGQINHGGIMLCEKDLTFIHSCTTDAPNPTGVKISSLSENLWSSAFVLAKRVVT